MSNNWPQAAIITGGAGGGGAGGYSTTAWVSSNLGATMSDSVFSVRSPKPDSIKAVKLTCDNIRNIGAELLKRGFAVEVVDNPRLAKERGYPSAVQGVLSIGGVDFLTGDWLVEEFDFAVNETVFRRASVADRQKYNLR